MERESGLELDTYFQYMLNSTHHVDVGRWLRCASPADSTYIDTGARRASCPCPWTCASPPLTGEVMDHHIPQVVTQGHRPLADGEVLLAPLALDPPHLHLGPAAVSSAWLQRGSRPPRRWTADADRNNNTALLWTHGLLQEWRAGSAATSLNAPAMFETSTRTSGAWRWPLTALILGRPPWALLGPHRLRPGAGLAARACNRCWSAGCP